MIDWLVFQCTDLTLTALTDGLFVCVDSKLEVPLPDVDYIEIPVSWWDAEADKSLLIGVHKHGEYRCQIWHNILPCSIYFFFFFAVCFNKYSVVNCLQIFTKLDLNLNRL